MIPATIMYGLLVMHFVADFVLQPRWMARGKSESLWVLMQHSAVHWMVFAVGLGLMGVDSTQVLIFTTVNAVLHAVVDWNMWRFYKGMAGYRMRNHKDPLNVDDEWQYWRDHWFYMTIGLDQLMHGATMIACYGMATTWPL